MNYKVGQKLIYIKDNSKIHFSNRYFITGHKYEIKKVSLNFIYVETRRPEKYFDGNVMSKFRFDIIHNYFKTYYLNKNIHIL